MATEKGITLYENPNYDGNPVTLDVGTYRLGALLQKGVINDSISSIKVPPGYTVFVYEHNLSGKSETYRTDTPYVGDEMNDLISSVTVVYDAEEAAKGPAPIIHEWGLEKLGDFDVALPEGGTPNNDKSLLLEPVSTYYIKFPNTEIFVRFDLKSVNIIQGVYISDWYYTNITDIRVGVHFDDTYAGQALKFPSMSSSGWNWFDGKPMADCNAVQTIVIPQMAARYVILHVKQNKVPHRALKNEWGIKHIQISKRKAS